MPCQTCGGVGARAAQTWIYQSPNGTKVEKPTEAEARQLVTINGGGQVYRKP